MNRNRLKQNLKNIATGERHLRFVYDRETELYVPYENEDEMRILADNRESYKIAFGRIDSDTGEYEEWDCTESYYGSECLMFNDEEYYDGAGCFVMYPLYGNNAYDVIEEDGHTYIIRSYVMYELVLDNQHKPRGYKEYNRYQVLGEIVE